MHLSDHFCWNVEHSTASMYSSQLQVILLSLHDYKNFRMVFFWMMSFPEWRNKVVFTLTFLALARRSFLQSNLAYVNRFGQPTYPTKFRTIHANGRELTTADQSTQMDNSSLTTRANQLNLCEHVPQKRQTPFTARPPATPGTFPVPAKTDLRSASAVPVHFPS